MDRAAPTDPRVIDILNRIKDVFARKGFDGASMQDLARGAGISVGNFYRYFPSKNAIVEAMVELDLSDVGQIFGRVLASDDPRRTFLDELRAELIAHRDDCDGPMWAEIEAASARRPEIAAIRARMEQEVGRYLIQTFALIGGIPEAEAAQRFASHAALIIVLFKGVAMEERSDDALIDLTISTIDRLMADIAAPTLDRPALCTSVKD